jgi:hypothetical protein
MLLLKYLTFGLSICTISWIVGIIGTVLLRRTDFYTRHLSHLNFLRGAALNRAIGLDLIKWVVIHTPFRFFNPGLKVTKRPDLAQLTQLRAEMTAAEIGHLIGFAFVVVFAVIKTIQVSVLFGLMIMLVNVPMNLYPSLLQQANKRRMDPLIQRLQARAQG